MRAKALAGLLSKTGNDKRIQRWMVCRLYSDLVSAVWVGLDDMKPWSLKQAHVQHLYLGVFHEGFSEEKSKILLSLAGIGQLY
jgi:hypothetical protein